MITDEQITRFDSDGFLNAGPILSEADVQELSDELNRIIEIGPDGFAEGSPRPVLFRDLAGGGATAADDPYGTRPGKRPVWQIVNIWEVSPVFKRLLFHPDIVSAISRMTGFGDLQIWHDQVQYKPAGQGGATTWHQDAPLWPSIEPMTPVSAWVPFDDAEVENGCMWMVPGSHKWGNQIEHVRRFGDLTALEDFQKIEPLPGRGPIETRPCPVKRGEVHFHHSLTWHGSPENHSTRPRRALAIHYMTSEARYTGRPHAMSRFIDLEVGAPMRDAGPHFPVVCIDGQPAGAAAVAS